MSEHTYTNEFGEVWRLQVDEDGTIRLGGDETDGEMQAIGFPCVMYDGGVMTLSWTEMAWLATVMAQLESRKKVA